MSNGLDIPLPLQRNGGEIDVIEVPDLHLMIRNGGGDWLGGCMDEGIGV